MAHIIFDFDGTLADTFPLIVDVLYRQTPRTKRRSAAEIDRLRHLPLLNGLLRLGIPLTEVPHLIRHTRKRLTDSIGQAPPFPGVPEMIKTLHKQGHQLFILSSNYPKNIQCFLEHSKLEPYITEVRGVSWGNTLIKAWALHRLASDYGFQVADCYHVGNEALDIKAARWSGMRGIGVTWSGYDRERLTKSGPFAMIDAPFELPILF